MVKPKRVCVQGLAIEPGKGFLNYRRRSIKQCPMLPTAIDSIPRDRMPDVTEMDAELVDAPRFQPQLEQGEFIIYLKDAVVSDRMTPDAFRCGHLPRVTVTSADTGVDRSYFLG
jgi:hypothetical protein